MLHARLTALKNFFLDFLFPVQCVGCGRFGVYVCTQCFLRLRITKEHFCVWCKQISRYGQVCLHCQNKSYFIGAWVIAPYEQELIQTILKHLKYRGVVDMVEVLGGLAEIFFTFHQIPKNFDCLIPVPIHQKKLLQRGFNQADALARSIRLRFVNAPCLDVLERTRATRPQYFLNAKKRKDNLESAFRLKQGKSVKDQNILLIDDIMTSGNTVNECARVLREAGARSVWCLVWAHG